MKVSVILPVYNEEQHISQTLDSLFNQNFDDYEIIIVDDGSTDDSLKIINEKLSGCEIPHKIIHQNNSGVSSARNRAIDESEGEFIVFVDGDDYILTDHLSHLYDEDADFCLTQLVKKDHDDVISPHYYENTEMTALDFIKLELEMKIPFNFVQLSYRADIIKKNNLKFREDVSYGEDSDFALRALSYGKNIKITNEITYYYIQRDESLISTSGFKRFDFIKVLEDLAGFYHERGFDDLSDLIHTSRIPKAIFGNMNYFFYHDYDFDEVISKMEDLDLFTKLSKYVGDRKYSLKIKLFLLNPKLYYKMWKKFKNSI